MFPLYLRTVYKKILQLYFIRRKSAQLQDVQNSRPELDQNNESESPSSYALKKVQLVGNVFNQSNLVVYFIIY